MKIIKKFPGKKPRQLKKKKKGLKLPQGKLLMIIVSVVVVGIIVSGAVILANQENGLSFLNKNQESTKPQAEKDKYVEFLSEIFDKVQENYWEVISDEDLFNLYKLGTEKLAQEQIPEIQVPEVIISNNKDGMENMIKGVLEKLDEEKKKDYATNLAAVVLANLQPFGRSGLYTQQKQEDLTNRVLNRDPNTDLYQSLEVTEDATQEEIEVAIEEKTNELEQITEDETQTEEARQEAEAKLALVERAQETIAQPEKREIYNENKIESTIYSEIVHPTTLYLKIKQLSPLTYDEFMAEIDQINQEADDQLDSLILDLRGNVGGSIDLMPYFLGPFIGLNRYAYDWYQQGEYTPFKTVTDWLPGLVRYKKVITLVDGGTQSSAEVMAATFKRYNVGVVVGQSTKGWGTIERVFELENQISDTEVHSLFLVHHITLRDDNQPIESRGVDPHINIDNDNWKEQLLNDYFVTRTMVNAVEEILLEE